MKNTLKIEEEQVDFVEVPPTPGQEFTQFSAQQQKDAFLGSGGINAEAAFSRSHAVGVRKKADGTLDFSRAAFLMEDDQHKLDAVRVQLETEKQEKQKQKYAIPVDVSKTSATYVWYELRNAIYTQQDQPAHNDPTGSHQAQERLDMFRREQSLLDSIAAEHQQTLLEMSQRHGRPLTKEQVRELAAGLPAGEARKYLERRMSAWERNRQESVSVMGQRMSLSEAQNAAADLYTRLTQKWIASDNKHRAQAPPPHQTIQELRRTTAPSRPVVSSAEPPAQKPIEDLPDNKQNAQNTPQHPNQAESRVADTPYTRLAQLGHLPPDQEKLIDTLASFIGKPLDQITPDDLEQQLVLKVVNPLKAEPGRKAAGYYQGKNMVVINFEELGAAAKALHTRLVELKSGTPEPIRNNNEWTYPESVTPEQKRMATELAHKTRELGIGVISGKLPFTKSNNPGLGTDAGIFAGGEELPFTDKSLKLRMLIPAGTVHIAQEPQIRNLNRQGVVISEYSRQTWQDPANPKQRIDAFFATPSGKRFVPPTGAVRFDIFTHVLNDYDITQREGCFLQYTVVVSREIAQMMEAQAAHNPYFYDLYVKALYPGLVGTQDKQQQTIRQPATELYIHDRRPNATHPETVRPFPKAIPV